MGIFVFWCLTAAISLAAAFALLASANYMPGFADAYSRHFYPQLVRLLGGFWGKVPFSAVEIFLYAGILFWLLLLLVSLVRLMQRKPHALRRLLRRLLALAATACVLFFVYMACCGVNYRAVSFSEEYGLARAGYDAVSLKEASRTLTDELISLSGQVPRGEDGLLQGNKEWGKESVEAMQALGKTYPRLAGEYPLPKAIRISRILSVQGVTGVYSPFTIEANYNAEMPAYNIPFTMCHELSHLTGFMREDEANFIGWLACRGAADPAFRYSSAMLGWIHCTNELAVYDPAAVQEMHAALPEEVQNELRVNSAFWEKYEGKAARVHEQVNDSYLKANGQEEGVRSYERMTELIVAYLQQEDSTLSRSNLQ